MAVVAQALRNANGVLRRGCSMTSRKASLSKVKSESGFKSRTNQLPSIQCLKMKP
jgi:hypothetical protein